MKVLVALAVLCLLQVIAGQASKDGNKLEQHNQGNKQENSQVSGQKTQVTQSTTDKQQTDVQLQSETQNVAQQHVAGQKNPNINTQHSSAQHQAAGKIPSKEQPILNQHTQHVPNNVVQYVANKERMVRSVKNRHNWQDMQVNAVQQQGKCDFVCDQPNVTACGYNGRCYWIFENQCELNTYNCLNTQKIFQVVDFAKCQVDGAPNCYRGDL